jgi:ribulose-5-phosphate 4-epimerase/fuculose-1-phosphate aldolase
METAMNIVRNADASMSADAAWQARIDLAAALRLAQRFGLNEGIDNHFTVMLPGASDRFLLHPFGLHWSEIRARDLIIVDYGGRTVEGEGEAESSAFHIHSRIHKASPLAGCVLHTHMPYATVLTMIEGGRLEPVHQNALRFYDDVAYDDSFNGLVFDVDEGDRLARCLAEKRVLFCGNHGVIVVGRTVAEAFDDLYFLERACQVQVLAMSTGRPLRRVNDEIAKSTFGNCDMAAFARQHFSALKRLLDRDEPDYAG